jgi:hypothetical protein
MPVGWPPEQANAPAAIGVPDRWSPHRVVLACVARLALFTRPVPRQGRERVRKMFELNGGDPMNDDDLLVTVERLAVVQNRSEVNTSDGAQGDDGENRDG